MTALLNQARASAAWLWRHASAGVAVLLIALALYLGYRLGAPAPMTMPAGEHEAHTEPQAAEQDQTQAQTQPDQTVWYTCSMHPSVRLRDPDAKCPICGMDLIPVATQRAGSDSGTALSLSAEAAANSRVETAPVARFFPTAEVRLYGKLTYDETSVARLTAYFPARIDRLFVNYTGVPVAKGDHLAEVYSPELLAAFEELRQALRATEESKTSSDLVRDATQETLKASREKLRLFGLTDAQIASVENGSLASDRLTIYAPMGGIVTHLAVREGDYVTTGEPIATVADLSRLWLDLQAYESQLPMIRWGQPVEFTVESHPGETFRGRVSFIEPIVNDRTRTAAVRVAVDNADRRLKPGMFASAVVRTRIAVGGAVPSDELAGHWVCPMHPTEVKDGPGTCDICGMPLVPAESLGVVGDSEPAAAPLVIPRTAVLFTGTRSVVYVRTGDADHPSYEPREVALGPRAGEFYVVRDGLTEGEPVVVHGAFRVDSAMQIAGKSSMMSGRHEMAPADSAGSSAEIPPGFLDSLDPVYGAYLQAHERLAADDLAGYLGAVRSLDAALDAVPEAQLTGEPLDAWRRVAAALRPGDAPPDIQAARAAFERLSEAVIALLRRFGHAADGSWSLVHCPMAFDFKGADWVQRGDEIINPYFGSSMLRCGEVRESFPAAKAADAEGAGHD